MSSRPARETRSEGQKWRAWSTRSSWTSGETWIPGEFLRGRCGSCSRSLSNKNSIEFQGAIGMDGPKGDPGSKGEKGDGAGFSFTNGATNSDSNSIPQGVPSITPQDIIMIKVRPLKNTPFRQHAFLRHFGQQLKKLRLRDLKENKAWLDLLGLLARPAYLVLTVAQDPLAPR